MMPLVPVLGIVSARVSRRFETKASRFSLAISTGFVIAVVGFVSTAFDRSGFADGLFGLFGSGFQAQQAFDPGPQSPQDTPRHPHATHRYRGRDSFARADGEPLASGRHSICVRLCDGYAFPVGAYHGAGDRASHEATCQSECPGAETALYVLPSGSDSIGDAVSVDTRQTYSKLPDAFHYSTLIDESCSCHPREGNKIKSLLHDFTLRRGDAVMTQTGFKVFHGGDQFPYKRRDFVALAHSRDIRKQDRAAFKAIERASLLGLTNVAQQPRAVPAVSDNRTGTKQLEHQASR